MGNITLPIRSAFTMYRCLDDVEIADTTRFHKCLQLLTYLGHVGKIYAFTKFIMYSDGSGYVANGNEAVLKSWNFSSIDDLYNKLLFLHTDYLRDVQSRQCNRQLRIGNSIIETLFL